MGRRPGIVAGGPARKRKPPDGGNPGVDIAALGGEGKQAWRKAAKPAEILRKSVRPSSEAPHPLPRIRRVDPALAGRHIHGLELAAQPPRHELVERREIRLGRGDERVGVGALGGHRAAVL
jgi:hypothetical protein